MIEMRKIIDITDLPADIKEFTYDHFNEYISGNNSYITHYVSFEFYQDEPNEDYTIFDKYLIEQGCVEGENIIILYWW